MKILKLFSGLKKANKGESVGRDEAQHVPVVSVGETRQARSNGSSLDSAPAESAKRLRGTSDATDEHNSSSEEVELDLGMELLSEHDAETARAVEVLRQLKLPMDATCLVPQRPSTVRSWDWAFPDNVHKIELSGAALGNELAAALATVLKPQKSQQSGSWNYPNSIASLLLSNAGIGAAGAVALAQLLEPHVDDAGRWTYNDGLTELDLSDNSISDEGAVALAAALKPRHGRTNRDELHCNTTLKHVWLGGNYIGSQGLTALVEALFPASSRDASAECRSGVEVLGMGHNVFGDDGACALARALEPVLRADGKWFYPYCLKSLNVWGSLISGEGGRRLLSALQPRANSDGSWAFNTSLESITMFRNDIDEASKADMRKVVAEVNGHRGQAATALLLMC